MLLVYTHKITKRFTYIARHLFTQMLGSSVEFTTRVEDFIKHTGPKITYTKQPLQNEFFIRSNDLLFERGINDFEIEVFKWDDLPCFFAAGERSNLPFDIFAASFYLISRYEEYLPHVRDEHGRFKAEDSLAQRHGFLKLPIIDLWMHKFKTVLQARFSDWETSPEGYRFMPLISVVQSHRFANRSLLRNVVGMISDILTLQFFRFRYRILVLMGKRTDPYDIFEELIDKSRKLGVRPIFFFQFAEYSEQDRNVAIYKNGFRYLIKSVADYFPVDLSASQSAASSVARLKEERWSLGELIHRDINKVRLRYLRVQLPHTYRSLIESEFNEDYSMGYESQAGFRAGTSHPFYFYDLLQETQQPLKVFPVAATDRLFYRWKKERKILEEIEDLCRPVRETGGAFLLQFSNVYLSQSKRVHGMQLYEKIAANSNRN